MTELKYMPLFNSVRQTWVSRHSNVTGNEIAHALAKQTACQEFIAPGPI